MSLCLCQTLQLSLTMILAGFITHELCKIFARDTLHPFAGCCIWSHGNQCLINAFCECVVLVLQKVLGC
jgi:hypothetical protein